MPDMPDLLDSASSSRGDHSVDRQSSRGLLPKIEDARTQPTVASSTQKPLHGARVAEGAPLLLFERASKWYGPVIGINQVTLELRNGITGLVGANGAGKSTLLRL